MGGRRRGRCRGGSRGAVPAGRGDDSGTAERRGTAADRARCDEGDRRGRWWRDVAALGEGAAWRGDRRWRGGYRGVRAVATGEVSGAGYRERGGSRSDEE